MKKILKETMKKIHYFQLVLRYANLIVIILLIAKLLSILHQINNTSTNGSKHNFESTHPQRQARTKPTKLVILWTQARSSSTTMCYKTLGRYGFCANEALKFTDNDRHVWKDFTSKERFKEIRDGDGEKTVELFHELYEWNGKIPVILKLFENYREDSKIRALVQHENSCVIKLHRRPHDSYCSLTWAKEKGDWSTNPKGHEKYNRTQWKCPAGMKRPMYRNYVIHSERWFSAGEPYYDVEIEFEDHVAQQDRVAEKISQGCGLSDVTEKLKRISYPWWRRPAR